ncbi:MAG: hypothetical protein WC329_04455 [Candidatus Omnitrophota bacterium]|jgi:hypothetical protein
MPTLKITLSTHKRKNAWMLTEGQSFSSSIDFFGVALAVKNEGLHQALYLTIEESKPAKKGPKK